MKKVYVESIKKWAIRIGIPSGVVGTIIGLIFLNLSLSGAITITGFSGDQVCAGTLDDPCYAYINFTANEDIFIYPIGYDPWGRETPFAFSPAVKDWKLQRSWGNGWRDIPLNISCTGTWCGAPNNKGVVYSYVLRDGKDYKFRIIAYKNSPYDTIKWAVNYEDREYLDPAWISPYENTYTKGTETHCKDGVCNSILYSGVRFVEEDDTWKKIEDARSLKNSGIECVVNFDGKHMAECEDWNYTSKTIKFKINDDKNKDIPIKNYKINYDADGKKIEIKTKEENVKFKDLKEEHILTIDSMFGDELHFGGNSTTIILQDNVTENLKDSYVRTDFPDANYAGGTYLYVGNNSAILRGYISFNLTSINGISGIESSFLYIYQSFNSATAGNISVHHIYNDWINGTGDNILDETQLTWNNQPCGVDFDNSTHCNLTEEDRESFEIGIGDAGFHIFNINNSIALDKKKLNISFALISSDETISATTGYLSKEISTILSRPYLNITYYSDVPGIEFTVDSVANDTTTSNASVKINVSITEDDLDEVKYNWNGTNFTLFNDSLILMYNLDNVSALGENSTHVVDVSGSGNNGTVVGNSNWIPSGKFNGAYNFSEAIGDRINFPQKTLQANMTISVWIKPDYIPTDTQYLYLLGDKDSGNNFFRIISSTVTQIRNFTGTFVTFTHSTVDTDWSNFVFVFNDTNSELYINGISQEVNNPLGTMTIDALGYGNGKSLNGSVDEFRVWNKTLNAEEVNQLYMSNLNKVNQSQWYLYVNQTKNVTDGLEIGNYTYFASAKDALGNEDVTETRSLSISAGATDTCTYTSGNWNIDCDDNCSIDSNIAMGGNDLVFNGAGLFYMNANITNYGNINLSSGCSIVLDDNTWLVS